MSLVFVIGSSFGIEIACLEFPFYYFPVLHFFQKGEKTMEKNEFIKLYVNASEETKKAIDRLLEEAQRPSEPPDLPLNTSHTIQ